jgi:hypothetical protein
MPTLSLCHSLLPLSLAKSLHCLLLPPTYPLSMPGVVEASMPALRLVPEASITSVSHLFVRAASRLPADTTTAGQRLLQTCMMAVMTPPRTLTARAMHLLVGRRTSGTLHCINLCVSVVSHVANDCKVPAGALSSVPVSLCSTVLCSSNRCYKHCRTFPECKIVSWADMCTPFAGANASAAPLYETSFRVTAALMHLLFMQSTRVMQLKSHAKDVHGIATR